MKLINDSPRSVAVSSPSSAAPMISALVEPLSRLASVLVSFAYSGSVFRVCASRGLEVILGSEHGLFTVLRLKDRKRQGHIDEAL